MKNSYIGLLLTVVLISCKERIVENNGLIGRWQLVETYRDPGNGSGKWMKPADAYLLEIRSDSTVIVSGKGSFLVADSTYVFNKVSQTYLEFKSGRGIVRLSARYKVTDRDLELIYPCIEGCGDRFKAVR